MDNFIVLVAILAVLFLFIILPYILQYYYLRWALSNERNENIARFVPPVIMGIGATYLMGSFLNVGLGITIGVALGLFFLWRNNKKLKQAKAQGIGSFLVNDAKNSAKRGFKLGERGLFDLTPPHKEGSQEWFDEMGRREDAEKHRKSRS